MQPTVCAAYVRMAEISLQLELGLSALASDGIKSELLAQSLSDADARQQRRQMELARCSYPTCTTRCALYEA